MVIIPIALYGTNIPPFKDPEITIDIPSGYLT